MPDELEQLEAKVQREESLKVYEGLDRVVLAEERFKEIEEEKKSRPSFSLKTDLWSIDDCLDGCRLGQLLVVSGPPKNGKTLLCQNFSERFTEQGHKCLWFSYELGYEEFLSKFSQRPLNFYIPHNLQDRAVDWVEDRIIEARMKYGIDVVFIDHLDFLRDPSLIGKVNLNLSSYVGGIVQRIKRIAVEQNVVIFLMSHIKKNKWTNNELPSSEDIRDSGQVAQLADIVMMIIRKRADKGSKEIYAGNEAIVGVIENRLNGKTIKTTVKLENSTYKEDLNDYTDSNSTDETVPEALYSSWSDRMP